MQRIMAEAMVTKAMRSLSLFALSLCLLLVVGCRKKSELKLPEPGEGTVSTAVGIQTSFAEVVRHVAPAVVTIHTEARVRAPQQFPFFNDPFFRQFFRQGQPQVPSPRVIGLGSGVIVTPDGYILTNHHVVDGAAKMSVSLNDGRQFEAKLIGSDSPSDLALIKIEASSLPVLVLGDSDKASVGDVVLAVGNPLNVGQTVTMGIISAKGRQTGLSNGSFEDFLQTDAPINRGNSGGALVNTTGELIGINSQILSPTGGSIGIGFAIPSNMARTVLDQIAKNGRVSRGQLGVVVQKVTADIAASVGLKDVKGVIVSQVQDGSAAEKAGLKQGDVIVALNGKNVDEPNVLRNQIAATPPGTSVTLTVLRNGNQQDVRAILDQFQGTELQTSSSGNQNQRTEETGGLGIAVTPLTPALARQLGVNENTQGLVVTQVDPDGSGAEGGLSQGDIIEQVNQQPVRSAADLKSVISKSTSKPVLLLINHRGTTIFLTVTPHS